MENMKENAKRWIWVTFQKVGYHRYPEAGTNPNLKDVKYLSAEHRHLFKFNIQIEIFHNNRELEFHQFLKFCEGIFEHGSSIDHKSVEMLSDDLYDAISLKYPNRDIKITVSEDGECGCLVEYNN